MSPATRGARTDFPKNRSGKRFNKHNQNSNHQNGSQRDRSVTEIDENVEIIDLNKLKQLNIKELEETARNLEIENASGKRRQELTYEVLRAQSERGGAIYSTGVLETLSEGFGFMRSTDYNYMPGPDDIYVSPSQIRRFSLRTGDTISGLVRPPKDGERYYALLKVGELNFEPPEKSVDKTLFDNLTPLYPEELLKLEYKGGSKIGRIADMFCPIGKGQRS